MFPFWAVRATEGWSAGSIVAAVLLVAGLIALVVWGVIKAAGRD